MYSPEEDHRTIRSRVVNLLNFPKRSEQFGLFHDKKKVIAFISEKKKEYLRFRGVDLKYPLPLLERGELYGCVRYDSHHGRAVASPKAEQSIFTIRVDEKVNGSTGRKGLLGYLKVYLCPVERCDRCLGRSARHCSCDEARPYSLGVR